MLRLLFCSVLSSLKGLLVASVYLVTASLWPSQAEAQAFDNCGTAQDPCQISTWAELDAVRTALDKHYRLVSDLSQDTVGYGLYAGPTANGGAGWTPIGEWQSEFIGTFDGNGFVISDLNINSTFNEQDPAEIGLFGFVGEPTGDLQGEIRNVTLKGIQYTLDCELFDFSTPSVGGVIGFKQQSINAKDLSADGVISWDATSCNSFGYVGGLIGFHRGELTGGRSTLVISINNVPETEEERFVAGGIAGINQGIIEQAASEGSVTAGVAGGIVGFNDLTILDSYSLATVTGEVDAGGAVGRNQGRNISRVYVAGSVTLSGTGDLGAIIGDPIVTPDEATGPSFWNGDVVAATDGTLGTALTQVEMRTSSSFSGWDFLETGPWQIQTVEAWSYPYLRTLTYDAIGASPAVDPIPGVELACEIGRFSATGFGSCEPCAAGSIAPVIGTTQCQSCPKGFIQPDSGQITCLACSEGETTSGLGATACVSELLFQDRFQLLSP